MKLSEEVRTRLGLEIVSEPGTDYGRFDDGSAEVEVLEFLYSFVRLIKPANILETGTYWGLSALYLALALKENGKGRMDTMEIDKARIETAEKKWDTMGVKHLITAHNVSSLDFSPKVSYDLLFLDSEPWLRFQELVKFYPKLNEGGYVFIHDMPRSLCQGSFNPDHPKYKSWPVGDLPPEVKTLKGLRAFYFSSARGLVGFYKKHKEDYL